LRLKILEKLRTASLNSEFTGSYKKKCNMSANIQRCSKKIFFENLCCKRLFPLYDSKKMT